MRSKDMKTIENIRNMEDLKKFQYRLMQKFLEKAKELKRIKKFDTEISLVQMKFLQRDIDAALDAMKIIRTEFENFLGY